MGFQWVKWFHCSMCERMFVETLCSFMLNVAARRKDVRAKMEFVASPFVNFMRSSPLHELSYMGRNGTNTSRCEAL